MPGPISRPGDRLPLLVPSPTIKQAFWRGNSQLKLGVFKDQDGDRVPGQGEGRKVYFASETDL